MINKKLYELQNKIEQVLEEISYYKTNIINKKDATESDLYCHFADGTWIHERKTIERKLADNTILKTTRNNEYIENKLIYKDSNNIPSEIHIMTNFIKKRSLKYL